MDRAALWTGSFHGNVKLLQMNGEGFTPDLAARRPAEGIASPAWILGHLVAYRMRLVAVADPSLPEIPPDPGPFGRGTTGEVPGARWEDLVAAFHDADQKTGPALRSVTDWDRPVRNAALGREQTLEQVTAFFYMHECYHLGQLGLARRLLGLPGVL